MITKTTIRYQLYWVNNTATCSKINMSMQVQYQYWNVLMELKHLYIYLFDISLHQTNTIVRIVTDHLFCVAEFKHPTMGYEIQLYQNIHVWIVFQGTETWQPRFLDFDNTMETFVTEYNLYEYISEIFVEESEIKVFNKIHCHIYGTHTILDSLVDVHWQTIKSKVDIVIVVSWFVHIVLLSLFFFYMFILFARELFIAGFSSVLIFIHNIPSSWWKMVFLILLFLHILNFISYALFQSRKMPSECDLY